MNNLILEIIGWVGYSFVMIGTIWMSFIQRVHILVWITWIAGNVCYLLRAIVLVDRPLFAIQLSFVILNVYGIINYFIRFKIRSKDMKFMICSRCGSVIAQSNTKKYILNGWEHYFDLIDRSWTCPNCKTVWYSSDGWESIENVVIPYRDI